MENTTVRITPTRRSIDNRFPVLGFDVRVGDMHFYEVLLTTDRKWFDPANASGRQAANFYSSRQDGGLIRATGDPSRYMAPAAVLRAFAQSEPKPTDIYYTLIAYRSADGAGPVFAFTPESLSTAAPSVSVAPSFTGQTLSAVLGISADKLRRVSESGVSASWDSRQASAYAAGNGNGHGAHVNAEDDRSEGEDGYGVASSLSDGEDDFWSDAQLAASSDAMDAEGGAWSAEDGYELNNGQPAQAAPQSYEYDEAESFAAEDGTPYQQLSDGGPAYDDGYGDTSGDGDASPKAAAQSSSFPAGMNEPQPLYDGEGGGYDDGGSLSYDEERYDFAKAASADEDETGAYPSEEFSYDPQGLGYQESSNGNGNGNGHAGSYQASAENEYETGGYGDEYSQSASADGDYGDEGDIDFQALDLPPEATVRASQPASGGGGAAVAAAPARTAAPPLTIDVKRRIIEQIARFESGSAGYKAINADGEYAGRFGTDHPAYHRYHIGLSYGNVQFTQDGGGLGRLLTMMRDRDAANFSNIFGPQADELIRVTNAAGPASKDSPGGRSARVQPIAGADIWEQPWRARFERAGDHVPFQAAQNELASAAYLDPMLRFAECLGLDTDRALAMVVDRSIQMGVGGARRWIIEAVGPVQTPALRQQALTALHKSDLRSFQSGFNWLQADGQWGALTHAAMVGALRALGAASPVPIPTREQMLDAMVRRAAGRRWAHRVEQLRRSPAFTDTVYTL